MGNTLKYSALFFIIIMIFINLAACSQKTTPEKSYAILEKVALAEKDFNDQQDPLVDLEKKEKAIYDKIIGIGMKQYDEIVKLSNEALAITDQRKKDMDRETKSIKDSEKEFKNFSQLKNKISDKKLKNKANELNEIMMKRYRAHDVLNNAYQKSITYDKQLYEMFKNKNISIDVLETQIDKVNETYKQIYTANAEFNKWTKQYNSKKQLFYKEADLTSK